MSVAHTAARVLAGAGIVAAAVVATALPAAAHVTIDPITAEPGGYGAFSVRVPNEQADADTTKVQLYLPADHPIASVSVQPVPGWSVQVTKGRLSTPIQTDDGPVTEAVTAITWSGGRIQPGRFQQFWILLGPLPTDTGKLYFKALQTYTDHAGKTSVVRWIDLPTGGAEPEHPAPSITLTKAPTAAAPAATAKDDDGTATVLGTAGLVAGLLGLAAGVVALVRSGRSAAP